MLARLNKPIVVLLLSCAAGCACSNPRGTVWNDTATTPLADCDITEPQPYLPDVSRIDQIPPLPAVQHCNLPEQEVQCTAAVHSAIANLIVHEAAALAESSAAEKLHYSNPALTREIVLLLADHQRNEDAASALEAFYRLAEAEAGVRTLTKQIEQLDASLRSISELERRNMLSPVSRGEIMVQRLDVEHRLVELQTTIGRLNSQLASLLNVELPGNSRFWPAADLTVDPQIPSSDEAVATALGNRSDLAALRLAASTDGRNALVASQLILPGIQSGLGGSSSLTKLAFLHRAAQSAEGDVRGAQLALVVAEREKAVREDALQAAALVHARLLQIELTKRRTVQLRQRVESLTAQRRLTPGVQGDLDRAEIDLLTADQALIHDIVEWKIAVMQLKQSQGLLARECGFDRARCND